MGSKSTPSANVDRMDAALTQAINEIYGTYGHIVSINQKRKRLTKFGENPNVGTSGRFTIWYTGQDITGDIGGYLAKIVGT